MRRLELWLGAAFLIAGVVVLAASGRFRRVAVSGHSMEPTLRDGDWLLVNKSRVKVARGDVVVARDPRARDRLIVKRVASAGTDSRVFLASDHPAHGGELIGPVMREAIVGTAVLRYWPPRRAGRVD